VTVHAPPGRQLEGTSVLVAGAGLAGLAAARDLIALGARVTVVDARSRVGGRVFTVRDAFAEGQHAEAGGDMINEEHGETRRLAAELGLKLTRILRRGWGFVGPDAHGRVRILPRGVARGWKRLSESLADVARRYQLAEQRWDSTISVDLGRRSVAHWLQTVHADSDLVATAAGLRGFFLADPEELSLGAGHDVQDRGG
jgi:monoamine oxidase